MSKEHITVPKVGMRKIKSIIAVVVAFLIWQIFRAPLPQLSVHPLFGYIYAIIEMRDSVEKTKTFGLRRIKATFIGLFTGLLLIPVSVHMSDIIGNMYLSALVDILLLLIGIVIALTLAEIFKCVNFCGVAAIIFVICIVRDRNSDINIYLYAIMRVVQTLIGVFSAWLVNSFVCRYPRGGKNEFNGN